MVKSEREQALLRRAALIADRAQLEAHDEIREGMSEATLYRMLTDRVLANGADGVLMIQVAAGERTSFSNPTPSERTVRRGEVVKIDVFVSLAGYLSDTGRAVVIGSSTQRQRDIWAKLQETLDAIEARIRPGATTRDLWQEFTGRFARAQMRPAIRFLGHGLGLSLHEEPFIAAHTDTVLEPGMVFALEPIYQDGDVAYHIEDNVLVTPSGVENLTTLLPRQLIVVGSGA